MASISNPYLSQIERGLYKPSADVLKSLAKALGLSPERLFKQAGFLEDDEPQIESGVEEAVRMDPKLSREQKGALLSVYRGFVNG